MSPWASYKGFSLLEIIIVTGILSIMVLTVNSFIGQSYRIEDFVSEQTTAVDEARDGVETFVQELREASAGDDGSYAVQVAGDQDLIFFSDIDLDSDTEMVHYYLDGTDLVKAVTNPTGTPAEYDITTETETVIAEYVQNGTVPIFYYYNGDYPSDTVNNPLATPVDEDEIKLVKISLEVNVTPDVVPNSYFLDSFTELRNLKTNL